MTPDLSTYQCEADIAYINRSIGISESPEAIQELLKKMQLSGNLTEGGAKVYRPCARVCMCVYVCVYVCVCVCACVVLGELLRLFLCVFVVVCCCQSPCIECQPKQCHAVAGHRLWWTCR